MKLDYSLTTPEERVNFVNKLLENTPSEYMTSQELNYISDYLLFVSDKCQTTKERKEEYPITTKNREVTINKRQISLEETISNLENGEDGLYALIRNDKNQLLDKKEPISQEDIARNDRIKEAMRTIDNLQEQFQKASGARKYQLKKTIIETWQQIYILKASARGIPAKGKAPAQVLSLGYLNLDEDITLDENQMPHSSCPINLFSPDAVSFLLCYYPQLKQEFAGNFHTDMYYLLLDLEITAEKALQNYEVLYDLLVWKIDHCTNEEIQRRMEAKYGIVHNEQYYSSVWRNRIPKLIAEQAAKDYVQWYFTNQEYGEWKQCGKCGEYKLAHPLFYSRNTSADGWYSICKDCRKN